MQNHDQRAIEQVLAGRTGEYRRIVEAHQDSVFRFAWNMIGNRQDAEDITQDVMLAGFDHLRSYSSRRGSVRTWLLAIARNRCVNFLRRQQRVSYVDDCTPADNFRPDEAAENREIRALLDAALNEMSPTRRAVFVLAEIERLGYAEIAAIENISLGTVKSRLHRAKAELSRRMECHFGDKLR